MGADDQFIVMDRKTFDGIQEILENNNYSLNLDFYSIGARTKMRITNEDGDEVLHQEIHIFTKGVF